MASENATLADIVAELRDDIDHADLICFREDGSIDMTRLADRIEAAWNREREELDKRISDLEAYAKLWTGRADELRLKCDEFYAKAKSVDNAAAMHEALESARNWCLNRLGNASYQVTVEGLLSIVNAALSAPARNCDRPECATSKDAQNVWRKEDGGKTPYYEWLLAPAAERKGEGDGR